MNTPAIAAIGLRKSFGDKLVLMARPERARGDDLLVARSHGAGKTTVVNILSTLIGADGGAPTWVTG
jgi:ABC-2 type transport system ATP-binding protein